ncbi:neutral/alkaline non-lysosomal ceramidase N-terminal domain-containing protein [Sediminitomix flava]|uniref:Neutral/alkaline ceramidase-like enzyme n=1 Tax=Sediminitomix flava TaxID=379075 RepID=A0A315Z0L9_SEDFL|nr:neutral/alkaline non-lysosomal ceramidase N-terminal domain-containing protein [Sediminitomix flava]PWJ36041.1 neutral/alkaline ceramidase-like enzyme [Sediminitomix flava]
MKRLLKFLGYFLGAILLFLVLTISPIDRNPFEESEAWKSSMEKIEKLPFSESTQNSTLFVSWAKANITPKEAVWLPAYGLRGDYQSVHDSSFVSVAAFKSHEKELFILGIDLMLFPPDLVAALEEKLSALNLTKDNFLFTATHTHNGFGGWQDSPAGLFIAGPYEEELVIDTISDQIIATIKEARKDYQKGKLSWLEIEAQELTNNRISREGTKDAQIRTLKLQKEDGSIGLVTSFAAHPTSLSKKIKELSRDYPGVLVDKLEADSKIDFAMFSAGMVGSQSPNYKLAKNYELVETLGNAVADSILIHYSNDDSVSSNTLFLEHFTLDFEGAQLRIAKDWKVNNWFFEWAMGDFSPEITVSRIGDVLWIGMPADFSAEIVVDHQLDKYAAKKGLKLMITSFNGNYIGYIMPDKYYDTSKKAEVREMNWVGPYKGEFFAQVIKKIIDKVS